MNFKLSIQNGVAYIKDALGLSDYIGTVVAVIGGILWLTTIGISFALIDENKYFRAPGPHDRNYYIAVAVCTIAAGVTVAIDYNINEQNFSTVATVFFGSLATFFSLGLWAVDSEKTLSTALVIVQAAANAIQLAAIFNHKREPVNERPFITNRANLLLQN